MLLCERLGNDPFETKPSPDTNSSSQQLPIYAFGKLQGSNMEFFLTRLKVTGGRQTDDSDGLQVDFIIPSIHASRQHIVYKYNLSKSHFEFDVLGRNGVFVNGCHVPGGEKGIKANHGDVFRIGAVEWTFE